MVFKTTDIVLAATLKVHEYSLIGIEKHGNKGTFCFDGVEDDFISKYDLGQLNVEPANFNNAIKALTTATRR